MTRRLWLAATVIAWLGAGLTTTARPAGTAQAASGDVIIFAASSLQTALDELVPQIARATSTRIRVSYAASSALARQIESGAPAGLFISADLDWMDYLAERRLVLAGTRANLLHNSLVLIAPTSSTASLTIGPGMPLARLLGRERLALANPASVPAGKYAKAALASLGVWSSVQAQLAPAENVRAALLLVSRGEAPLGIVYRTDALADRGVRIVDTFPAASHGPIVYPAAVTAPGSQAAERVLAFLRTAPARAVFARQGFGVD
ncbi:MAG: molybdate ABC transporter substrate-binding protein [Acidobacteria bacterium]|nr:molybdate ABC transporter substrate-binding protein [Acidobacteriota bacterium]